MKPNLKFIEHTIEILFPLPKKDELMALADEIGEMITSLITYLGKSDFRGTKFKGRDKKES